jgi:hypothetical protein
MSDPLTPDDEAAESAVSAEVTDDDGLLERLFPLLSDMDPRDRWIEIISAVLLAVAVIATAWSGYQATRWGGVQANAFAAAGAARTESTRASTTAGQLVTIDVTIFVEWAGALSEDNDVLADFLEERMRDEFKPALDAWLATEPLDDPDAPPTPFAMPEYELADEQAAEDLLAEAELKSEEARDANQTGDDYVLTTVLFAAVLFFGGVGTKFKSRFVKSLTILLGAAIFVTGAVLLASYPIE